MTEQSTNHISIKPFTQREALARTAARSDHAVLDFSLVTFFASRQRKWQTFSSGESP